MMIEEYQKKTNETAIYPENLANEYLICGLMSETAELCIAINSFKINKIEDELGDCFWYSAQIAEQYTLDLKKYYSIQIAEQYTLDSEKYYSSSSSSVFTMDIDKLLNDLFLHLGVFAACVKRSIRDKDGISSINVDQFLNNYLNTLLMIVKKYSSSLSRILSRNIIKLSDRKKRNVLQGRGGNR